MKSGRNDSDEQFEKPMPSESMAAEAYESIYQEEGHRLISTAIYYGLEDDVYDGAQDWLASGAETDGSLYTEGDF